MPPVEEGREGIESAGRERTEWTARRQARDGTSSSSESSTAPASADRISGPAATCPSMSASAIVIQRQARAQLRAPASSRLKRRVTYDHRPPPSVDEEDDYSEEAYETDTNDLSV